MSITIDTVIIIIIILTFCIIISTIIVAWAPLSVLWRIRKWHDKWKKSWFRTRARLKSKYYCYKKERVRKRTNFRIRFATSYPSLFYSEYIWSCAQKKKTFFLLSNSFVHIFREETPTDAVVDVVLLMMRWWLLTSMRGLVVDSSFFDRQ